MISGKELSFVDTLLISISGMAIVMLELILIALMILIMAKLLRNIGNGQNGKADPASAANNAGDKSEDEIQAVIMSVISEDLQTPLEELNFKSFKSL